MQERNSNTHSQARDQKIYNPLKLFTYKSFIIWLGENICISILAFDWNDVFLNKKLFQNVKKINIFIIL